MREGIEPRLADSFETALKLAEGLAYLDPADGIPLPLAEGREAATRRDSRRDLRRGVELDRRRPAASSSREKFACPVCGFTIAEIEPRLFSFNAPQGACPACDGLGEKLVFDEDLVVPNHALVDQEGRRRALGQVQPALALLHAGARALARAYDFDLDNAVGRACPRRRSDVILHGTKGRPVTLRFIDGRKSYEVKKPFEGVIGNLNRRMLQTESAWMREELSRYQSSQPVRDLPRRPPQARTAWP